MQREQSVGPIADGGAFTSDFALAADIPFDQVPGLIERDRSIMATRPGMLFKHLPFRIDPASGLVLTGGRYLFDTIGHAQDYRHWTENSFALDGIHFWKRPYFLDPVIQTWEVVGAHALRDVRTQVVMRTERWQLPNDPGARDSLGQTWQPILQRADQRGLTGVWLLFSQSRLLLELVYFADRVGPRSATDLDIASLAALESAPPLGASFADLGGASVVDRTQFVLTVWFPLVTGEAPAPALWPNSPPLPAPASVLESDSPTKVAAISS